MASVAFSPDGKTLAIASADGTGGIWQLSYHGGIGSLISQVCDVVGASLTRREWADYIPGQPFQKVCPQR